jgi:hypothetical protein
MRGYPLLRAALVANAAFSGTCSVLLLGATPTVGSWLGIDLPAALFGLGVALALFTMALGWIALRSSMPIAWVRVITASDFLWVLATVVLLAGPWQSGLSERGAWIAVVVAQCVLLCGVLQSIGLRLVAEAPAAEHPDGVIRGVRS